MRRIDRRMLGGILVAAGLAMVGHTPANAQAAAADRTFQLATVTGAALPVVVEDEGDCREELLSATLVLSNTGRWTLTTSERETCGADVTVDDDTDMGMYRITGENVQFMDSNGDIPETLQASVATAPDEIEVEELSVGSLTANSLSVRLTDGHTVLVFRE